MFPNKLIFRTITAAYNNSNIKINKNKLETLDEQIMFSEII